MNKDKILALFRTRKQHTLSHHSAFFSNIARRYDLYRGYSRQQYGSGYNHVMLPELFGMIQNDVARKMQTMFSGDKFIEFAPRNSTDGQYARKVTALVNAQMADCDTPIKAQDFFLTADMYGTAFARHGWKTIRRYEQFRKYDEDKQQELVANGLVTRFDGPDWEVLDMLDVWPQPGRRRLADCRWVMVRYFMDLDELKLMDMLGVYENGAIRELEQTNGAPGFVDDAYATRRYLYRSTTDYQARSTERYNKLVECVDMFGYVPDEMAPDGFNFRLITVANDRVILKNKPFPFWHGDIPILSYSPMADPHYIHGVGKIEITERLQYLANRWLSQKADAVDISLAPMVLFNRQSGIDPSNTYTRAGRWIGADGPVGDDTVRPFPMDFRSMPMVNAEIREIRQIIQQSIGMIEDTMLGGESGKEQTATEFGGRTSAVMNRQGLELLCASKLFLEPLGNYFHQNNRQFLKSGKEVMLIGEDASTDPITGMPNPPEMQAISLEDLNRDYRAVAIGGTMIGKGQRRQDIQQLTMLLQANPAAVQAMNWGNWLRYVLTQYDLPNTKDFFNTGQVPGLNQMAAATGQDPGQVANALGGQGGAPPLSQLLGG